MTKKSRRVAKARRALLALSLVLVTMLVTVGGTIAWLTAESDTVTNTFSTSDIAITLDETGAVKDTETGVLEKEYQFIPGVDLAKDPDVTVESDVDCFVFVKMTVENWPTVKEEGTETLKIGYTVASPWKEVTGATGLTANEKLYYAEKSATEKFENKAILVDDKITVSETLTKGDMENIKDKPTMTFEAYAIQKASGTNTDGTVTTFQPAEAWAEINK